MTDSPAARTEAELDPVVLNAKQVGEAVSAIGEALGLFPSCIKSGEDRSSTCQRVLDRAREAVVELAVYATRPQPAPSAPRSPEGVDDAVFSVFDMGFVAGSSQPVLEASGRDEEHPDSLSGKLGNLATLVPSAPREADVERARAIAADTIGVKGSLREDYLAGTFDNGDHVRIARAALAAITPTEPADPDAATGCADDQTFAAFSAKKLREAVDKVMPTEPAAIPMILHCPKCGVQHVDEPEDGFHEGQDAVSGSWSSGWDNPPHRSHLCHGCGCIWRPADVATEGVRAIATKGAADTWSTEPADDGAGYRAGDVVSKVVDVLKRIDDGIYASLDERADAIFAALSLSPTEQSADYRAGHAVGIEDAAKLAETRHERWRMPHPDDAQPGEVCCDVSACRDIATAIRALSPASNDGWRADMENAPRDAAGWIVMSGDGKRFRTWKDGWSAWTDNRDEAARYARRVDAEAVHSEDEDAWSIVPYALPNPPSERGA